VADIDDVEKAYGDLSRVGHLDEAELLEIGQLGITIVVARTKHGHDADGKFFKPYTPDYAEDRRRSGLQTSPVDLARKGHMLGGMTPMVTGENEVMVGFASEHEAIKAAAISEGVHKTVSVRTRGSRRGQRAQSYARRMNMDARDFLDIRRSDEMNVLGDEISEKLAAKALK
jgi:hypothetical protein